MSLTQSSFSPKSVWLYLVGRKWARRMEVLYPSDTSDYRLAIKERGVGSVVLRNRGLPSPIIVCLFIPCMFCLHPLLLSSSALSTLRFRDRDSLAASVMFSRGTRGFSVMEDRNLLPSNANCSTCFWPQGLLKSNHGV